jgi:hypothetical protein
VCATPEGIYRKSLAIYYLTDLPENVDTRSRALFGLVGNQELMTADIDACPHLLTVK